MDNNEIWRPVTGFEGVYECSNLGRARSCSRVYVKSASGPDAKRPSASCTVNLKGRVLAVLQMEVPAYRLYFNNKYKTRTVHSLIEQHFNESEVPKDVIDKYKVRWR